MYNYLVQKNGALLPHSKPQYVDFSDQNEGLGPLLVLYVVYKLLDERKLSLDDSVEITEMALQERGRGVVGYALHDKVNLFTSPSE